MDNSSLLTSPTARSRIAHPSLPTVLIVEDSETDRATYIRHLRSSGDEDYEILEAETLEDALELWRVRPPEVVLLDVNLPDGDGLEFLEAIAPEFEDSQLPAIVLTGQGDERTAVRSMKLGASDYLTKGDITALSLCIAVRQVRDRVFLTRKLARSRRQEALVAEIALRVREYFNLQDISEAIVREVGEFLGADRAVIYQFNPDMSGTITAESVVAPWNESLGTEILDTCFQENLGGAYRENRVFACEDIYTAGLSECHIKLLERFQVRANLVVPVLLPEGETWRLWGLLVVHQCRAPRVWEEGDIELLRLLSVQFAIAVKQAELYQSLQALNASLELTVEERTRELKLSEKRFRGIFENMFQFIGLLNPDGTLLEANRIALAVGGVGREAVVGRPFWEAPWWQISPETREQLRGAIARAARGEFVRYEVEIWGTQGTIPIDFSLRPVADEAGRVILIIPEGRDLTEAKRLETEREEAYALLRESERRYASLAAAAPVGIFRTDIDGNCVYANDRWCAIAGLTPEMAMGTGWVEMLHPDDRDWVLKKCAKTLAERSSCQCEFRIVHPDGALRWVYGQSVPEWDDGGQLLGYVGTLTDISDRKRAEEQLQELNQQLEAKVRRRTAALQERETRYRALMENAGDAILLADVGGNLVEVNRQAEELFGHSREELIGIDLSQIHPPEDLERMRTTFSEVLRGDRTQVLDARIVRRDGAIVDVDISATTIEIGDSRQCTHRKLVQGIFRDITERKAAEKALRESETRWQFALEGSGDGIWDWDAGTNRVFFSKAWKAMLGYADEDIGDTLEEWSSRVHPEDLSQCRADLDRHFRGETPVYQNEHRMFRKDGSIAWILDRGQVIEWTAEGKPLRVIGTHTDISDRKAAEEENRLLKERLQFLLARSPAMIYSCRPEGDYGATFMSPNVKTILGYDPEEFTADSSFWANHIHPEDAPGVLRSASEVFQKGTIAHEYRFLHKAGHYVWLMDELRLVCDEAGEPVEIVGYWANISDRKVAEIKLQRTNEELLRATRLKDEFLANMSHELRTPLNAILGMTEGLQEEVFGPVNERQIRALATIESSGSHLLSLINDILDLAKIEAGQVQLECAPTAIAPLCRSSLNFVQQQAMKKNIKLTTKVPENLPDWHIDERRIRQVLINLLTNAVKFTPEGGRIGLEVFFVNLGEPGRNRLRIAVMDTGIGIAPENLDKLFRPFVQIDGALNRKYEGTGLGLALVKQIVELHGGEVGVSSEVGTGSCFTVDLPGGDDSQAWEPPVPSASEAEPESSEPPPPARILLAEDNEANISTMSSYLGAKGYRLMVAKNGAEAIGLARSERPDLILMDVQMPGMDGLEAIRHIRRDRDLAEVPIVALTALAMNGDRDRCLEAGATEYLGKPVRLKELVAMIQQLL
ncbi:PAS domain S-box protein [Lyngbya sp. CCY1209]|uniref:PAS domain S-box protein n=1 Tax=Lyngbya sp. CCY1209 TaxID=2886103 RepID=UPI002D202A44|nr:PAS domain S-box protein [Lyngbya sp. CCY1209]MEB3884752.1 PAS domain S-box protein [Lyngbya sp. CCY1209]